MKSKEEIEANLAETELELREAQSMYESELNRYEKDLKFWGTAERTNVQHANHIVDVLISKINAFNWVLEN